MVGIIFMMGLLMGLLGIAGVFNPSLVAAPLLTEEISVDAIAVYPKTNNDQGDIYYSFFGHKPAIPVPVDDITEWKWWTLESEDVASAPLPSSIEGDDQTPSIAFSKEGFAVAVWSNSRQVSTIPCGDAGFPDPVYQGDILFSVWDGETWSMADVAVAGAPDTSLFDPAIAIDGKGDGLLIFIRNVLIRGGDGCSSGAQANVEYATFDGQDKSFALGEILDGPTDVSFFAGPEVAFTSKIFSGDTKTRHQAVAAWWSTDTLHEKVCIVPDGDPFTIQIPTFWPKQAVWNGNSFENIDFVPDKPIPPPDLSDNLSVIPGKKLGISSDQFDHASVVWGVGKGAGDPCDSALFSIQPETWNARWDGSQWDGKAAPFDVTDSPVRGIDIAYLAENEAISVYDAVASTKIRWSLQPLDSSWESKNQLDSAIGFTPTIASLAHGKTVAIWTSFDGQKILWSERNDTGNNAGLWSAAQFVALGTGQADIAAHTGSPTQDKSRWTFMTYQAADQKGKDRNLMAYLTDKSKNNFKEMEIAARDVGGRVHVVGLFDRHSEATPNTTYMVFTKEGKDVDPKPKWLKGNMNTADPTTLQDFIATTLEKFPASRNFVVISDHGGAWIGSCQDQLSPGTKGNDILTLPETKTALDAVLRDKTTNTVKKKLDLIGFQACSMSQLEVAYQIRDYGEFMIGHESLGFGKVGVGKGAPWDFQTILDSVGKNILWKHPNLVGAEILEKIAAQITKNEVDSTISMIELDEVANLAKKVGEFADELIKDMGTQKANIQKAIKETKNFNAPNGIGGTFTGDFRDVLNFAQRVKINVDDVEIDQKADEVFNAVEGNAVAGYQDPRNKYICMPGGDVFQCGGLSIWIPLDGKKYDDHKDKGYNYSAVEFNKDHPKWMEFLGKVHDSTTIVVELKSPDPFLFHSIEDDQGRFVGADSLNIYDETRPDQKGICGGGRVEIEGADYVEKGSKKIYLPEEVSSFTWTVDARDIASASASFELVRQTWVDLVKTDEEILASGVINLNGKISGQFPAPVAQQVQIDIKPGDSLNEINPKSKGVIPLALLTTETFDAQTADIFTVTFGPGMAKEVHQKGHREDIDGDGDLDLVLHFATQDVAITKETELCLSGKTINGTEFMGCDFITRVGSL